MISLPNLKVHGLYWHLIQTAHFLCEQEKQLEFAVIDILDTAGASEYIPTFARHRITIETFCVMDENDLKQVRNSPQITNPFAENQSITLSLMFSG